MALKDADSAGMSRVRNIVKMVNDCVAYEIKQYDVDIRVINIKGQKGISLYLTVLLDPSDMEQVLHRAEERLLGGVM